MEVACANQLSAAAGFFALAELGPQSSLARNPRRHARLVVHELNPRHTGLTVFCSPVCRV